MSGSESLMRVIAPYILLKGRAGVTTDEVASVFSATHDDAVTCVQILLTEGAVEGFELAGERRWRRMA